MSIGGHSVPRLPLEAYHRRRQRCQSTSDIKAASPKPSTMESVRIAFHAQLATVMDSLLAAAVCEIAKIFESSLCEQQVALAQKTDEISVLRSQLEKQERRAKAKCGGSEEGEKLLGDRESSRNHQSLTGSGLNVEDDRSTQSDPMDRLSGGLKEEVIGQDGASVKHEPAVSQPARESIGAQASEGSISAADERQTDSSAVTQAKAKLSQWDQGSHSADHRPLQDQGSTPFLSISQSGRCSPRADPSLSRPAEWLPSQYPPSQGGVSSLENLQADGTSCSGTDTSSFRPGFVSDETSNEDDNDSFPFLDQEPENQNSNQKSVQGQGVVQRVVRQVQHQAQAGEATWRLRDNSGGGGSISHPRRVTTFGNRDPLQPQSNSLSLMPRQSNSFSHAGSPGGGNGRPYTCPYCTKCFTYPSHQRRHLLRHTGVRLHPCQFCEKSFLTPSELTVHTRTHTGERPFGCAQCGKRFARSGNLRAHQRDVHLGKRPFACTECGKRFAHRGNLRVHNHRVHQGDPYYMEDQQQPEIVLNPI